jgi:hypothetical protein
MEKDRVIIIERVCKLRALSVSERKLGNHSAANTAQAKVTEMIAKYSITTSELDEPSPIKKPHKSYNSYEEAERDHRRQQEKAYSNPWEEEENIFNERQRQQNRYGDQAKSEQEKMDDVLRELYAMHEKLKREAERAKRDYGTDDEYESNRYGSKEKEYRYRGEFVCPTETNWRYMLTTLASRAGVRIEEAKDTVVESSSSGFFGWNNKPSKISIRFVARGTAKNLTRFKEDYQEMVNKLTH